MSNLAQLYLGNPSGPFGMLPLPLPPPGAVVGNTATSTSTVGVTATASRGTTSAQLLSGGTAIFRRPKLKQSYALGWTLLAPSDVDLLMSFFDGRQGIGPYCLVDPSWSNFLPPNVAAMGGVTGVITEWGVNTGQAIAPSTAIAPPAGLYTGVAAWTGAGIASILYGGLYALTDGTWLPPIIQGLSTEFTIRARVATGTLSVKAQLQHGVAGSAPAGTAATGSNVTLNATTWQSVTVGTAASFSWPTTSDYIVPELISNAASAPTIYLAAPEFGYDTAAAATPLTAWASGIGVPRCVLVGDAPIPVDMVGWREFTMQLAEV